MTERFLTCTTSSSGTPINNTFTGELLIETALELFGLVERDQYEEGISDQYLLALHNLFQQHLLLQALELVDQVRVTCCVYEPGPITGGTGLVLGQTQPVEDEGTQWTAWEKVVCMVKGSSNKDYVCCISSTTCSVYCSCPSFVFSVKMRREVIMCKHLLASCLGLATRTYLHQLVDQRKWEELWKLMST